MSNYPKNPNSEPTMESSQEEYDLYPYWIEYSSDGDFLYYQHDDRYGSTFYKYSIEDNDTVYVYAELSAEEIMPELNGNNIKLKSLVLSLHINKSSYIVNYLSKIIVIINNLKLSRFNLRDIQNIINNIKYWMYLYINY